MKKLFLACFVIVGTACVLTRATNELAAQNNAFSTKLFSTFATDNKNYICSPLSVSIVMSMLIDGARGDTATEIRNALEYSDTLDIDKSYGELLPKLKPSNTNFYTLSLANSIWVLNDFPVEQDFSNKMQTVFNSEANGFTSGNEAAGKINTWVSDHTNKMIPKLIDDPSVLDSSVMVLVNAIYFKGNWVHQFPNDSLQGDFNNGDSTVKVTYMRQTNRFLYKESSKIEAKIVHLPYKGEETYLVLVLPNEGSNTVNNVIGNPDFISEAFDVTNIYPLKVDVKIPKFKIETTIPLNAPLTTLGIEKAFSDSADFSGISGNNGVKISTVLQKAVIDVNELGSEAAAATFAAIDAMGSVNGSPEIVMQFYATSPFIYAIYHKPTESILFLGKFEGV